VLEAVDKSCLQPRGVGSPSKSLTDVWGLMVATYLLKRLVLGMRLAVHPEEIASHLTISYKAFLHYGQVCLIFKYLLVIASSVATMAWCKGYVSVVRATSERSDGQRSSRADYSLSVRGVDTTNPPSKPRHRLSGENRRWGQGRGLYVASICMHWLSMCISIKPKIHLTTPVQSVIWIDASAIHEVTHSRYFRNDKRSQELGEKHGVKFSAWWARMCT